MEDGNARPGVCRPNTSPGRQTRSLPQKFMQHYGYNGAQQDKHGTNNADLVVPAVAFRAVAVLWRHGGAPLSVRAHEPCDGPRRQGGNCIEPSAMPTMKASHDPCDRSGRPVAPLYLGGYRASAVLVLKAYFGCQRQFLGQPALVRPAFPVPSAKHYA